MGNANIKNRVYDGDRTFVLGCDSLDYPWKLPVGQYSWGFNVVNRGNEVSTRPGYSSLLRLCNGNAQGITLFQPTSGSTYLVFAVAGSVYASPAPFTTCRKLPNIQFSAFVDHVTFCTAVVAQDLNGLVSPYSVLMMQDGRGRAAYWDGSISRHLDPGAPKETKIGLWMEWVGNRLWVAFGRQIFASDIFDPLHFTENGYLAAGGSFQAMDGQPVTGLKRTSNSKQLLVYTEGNTTRIQAGITDRATWKTTPDFVAILFPGVGAVSGTAIVDVNGEIMWMSREGVRRYNAVGDSVQNAKNPIASQEMERSQKNLSPILSRACAFHFGSYAGFSVPSGDIYNRHTWVIDSSSSDKLSAEYPLAWQGVWTGTRPVQWASGTVNGVNRCFFISQDFDAPRIWEAFKQDDADNGYPISCFLETRGHLFNESMNMKTAGYVEGYLGKVRDNVNLNIDYRTEWGCWKNVANVDYCATSCVPWVPCTPAPPTQRQSRYIKSQEALEEDNEPGAPFLSNIGVMMQARFRWMGRMCVRAYRLSADEFEEIPTGDITFGDKECQIQQCCDPEPDYISMTNDHAPYYYADNCCAISNGNQSL